MSNFTLMYAAGAGVVAAAVFPTHMTHKPLAVRLVGTVIIAAVWPLWAVCQVYSGVRYSKSCAITKRKVK